MSILLYSQYFLNLVCIKNCARVKNTQLYNFLNYKAEYYIYFFKKLYVIIM